MPEARTILSIHALTTRVRQLLEKSIGRVWIEGEVSNLSAPSSGHLYFTLKDEGGQIQAAWFKGRRSPEALLPRDGMKVRVYGLITAYERGAQIQILVEQAEDAGAGDLMRCFEELKAKLKAEGLFEASRKKPLPLLPRRIGIVTSPTGAAIRDILTVLERRFPDRHILLAPVPVQGAAAADSIARAIQFFNTQQLVDVIIVGRGGGSLEDLWSFNEEVVARAVAASVLPIISAVGHETDFSICDFVADLRAPTPSAAAELVIGRKEDFQKQIARLEQRLGSALDQRRLRLRNRLERARGHRFFHEPRLIAAAQRQKVTRLNERLRNALQRRVSDPQKRLTEMRMELRHNLERRLRDSQRHLDDLRQALPRPVHQRQRELHARLEQMCAQLRSLNPKQVLRRGYSITRIEGGGVIENVETLRPGQKLETLTQHGTLHSTLDHSEAT
jgi:exodeoxyribonuclease VII large subunit